MTQFFEAFRYDIVTIGAYSGSDARLTPKSGSLVLYRKGATITTGATVSGGVPTACAVSDPGTIIPGDVVQVFNKGVNGTVKTAGYAGHSITVTWDSGFQYFAGDRVIVKTASSQPTAYSDPYLQTSIGSTVTFSATDGWGAFYCREPEIDIIRTTSSTTDVIPDVAGKQRPETLTPLVSGMKADGLTSDSVALNNRITYAQMKGRAIIDLPPGDIVLTGTGTVDTFLTCCNIDGATGISFRGAGRGVTRFILNDTSSQAFYIGSSTASSDVSFSDLSIVRSVGSPTMTLVRIGANAVRTRFARVELVGGAYGIIDAGTETTLEDISFSGTGWIKGLYLINAKRPYGRRIVGRFGNSLGATDGFIHIEEACENVDLEIDVAPTDISGSGYRGTAVYTEATTTAPAIVRIRGRVAAGIAGGGYPCAVVTAGTGLYFDLSAEDGQYGYSISGSGTEIQISGQVVGMQEHGIYSTSHSSLRLIDLVSSNVAEGVANSDHVYAPGTTGIIIRGLYYGNPIRGGITPARYVVNGSSDIYNSEFTNIRGNASLVTDIFYPVVPTQINVSHNDGTNGAPGYHGSMQLIPLTAGSLSGGNLNINSFGLVFLDIGTAGPITGFTGFGGATQQVTLININATTISVDCTGTNLHSQSGSDISLAQYQGVTFVQNSATHWSQV